MSVRKYLSLVVFSHTAFALPFALIGYTWGVLAVGFDWTVLVKVLLCMVTARNAAMGFNRLVDRRIDARNPRTATREIPAGKLSVRQVKWFVAVNVTLFVALAFSFNLLTGYLSPVALAVILGYSYTKRFTALCHLILGLGLAISPSAAYIAVTGTLTWMPVVLSGLVFTWVSGFDIIYALQDADFDREQGLHSIPSRLGARNAVRVSLVLHALTVLFVAGLGWMMRAEWLYWIGALFFVSMLCYQHSLVRPDDTSRLGRNFGTVNGVSSVVFCLFILLDVLLR